MYVRSNFVGQVSTQIIRSNARTRSSTNWENTKKIVCTIIEQSTFQNYKNKIEHSCLYHLCAVSMSLGSNNAIFSAECSSSKSKEICRVCCQVKLKLWFLWWYNLIIVQTSYFKRWWIYCSSHFCCLFSLTMRWMEQGDLNPKNLRQKAIHTLIQDCKLWAPNFWSKV